MFRAGLSGCRTAPGPIVPPSAGILCLFEMLAQIRGWQRGCFSPGRGQQVPLRSIRAPSEGESSRGDGHDDISRGRSHEEITQEITEELTLADVRGFLNLGRPDPRLLRVSWWRDHAHRAA